MGTFSFGKNAEALSSINFDIETDDVALYKLYKDSPAANDYQSYHQAELDNCPPIKSNVIKFPNGELMDWKYKNLAESYRNQLGERLKKGEMPIYHEDVLQTSIDSTTKRESKAYFMTPNYKKDLGTHKENQWQLRFKLEENPKKEKNLKAYQLGIDEKMRELMSIDEVTDKLNFNMNGFLDFHMKNEIPVYTDKEESDLVNEFENYGKFYDLKLNNDQNLEEICSDILYQSCCALSANLSNEVIKQLLTSYLKDKIIVNKEDYATLASVIVKYLDKLTDKLLDENFNAFVEWTVEEKIAKTILNEELTQSEREEAEQKLINKGNVSRTLKSAHIISTPMGLGK